MGFEEWIDSRFFARKGEKKLLGWEVTDQSCRSRKENGTQRGAEGSSLGLPELGGVCFRAAVFDLLLGLVCYVQFVTVMLSTKYSRHIT